MSSKPQTDRKLSLALRLTLWYAGVFTVFSIIVFAVFYYFIARMVHARTDADLIEDVEELSRMYQQGGLESLRQEFHDDVVSAGADKVFFRVISSDSRVLLSTDTSSWSGLPEPAETIQWIPTQSTYSLLTMALRGKPYPARVVTAFMNGNTILQFGETLEFNSRFLRLFRTAFATAMPLIVLLSCVLAWILSRKALQGIREVSVAAGEITAGNLLRRVPESGRGDEIDTLAKSFNSMLDRIQKMIDSIQEMTDNIAHDLRSPLARIRAIAEASLLENPANKSIETLSHTTIEECDRLLHMVNTMLDITESEAGVFKRSMILVDLPSLLEQSCELYRPLAENQGIQLTCNSGEPVTVLGSLPHLQRMLANLLENAIKYTGAGGSVEINLSRNNGQARIAVTDTGAGINAIDLPFVFDRFYRGENPVSGTDKGLGLGLSLALAIARAHGGEISVSSSVRRGTTFTVELPAT